MKKKIIGIIIVMLLIGTMVLPVTGRISLYEDNYLNENSEKSVSENTELKWMIAGDGLRHLHSYWLHVPPSYDGSKSVPLVLVLQGSAPFNSNDPFGCFRRCYTEEQTLFSEKADEEDFIVVYPNAKLFFHHIESGDVQKYDYNYAWIPPLELGYIDDIGFISDLIDKMKQDYSIDLNRIYITGFSAGALMTHSVGSYLSDEVAAIAPVAGSVGGRLNEDDSFSYIPTPENPVSVIVLHGTKDFGLPYEGGPHYVSVNESVSFWVEQNGCDSIPEINSSESGKTIRRTYTNEDSETEVVLITLIGLDHRWPYICNICEISGTDLIWDFFESHPKQ